MEIEIIGSCKDKRRLFKYVNKAVEVFKDEKENSFESWSWTDGKLQFWNTFYEDDDMELWCTFKDTSFDRCRIQIRG